ncbi:YeeE/YedE family protein [Ferrimonas pelagia]|uniref:YeeE/YedE family protein n=1 Tax=Ferrimonas pelagia TaxID=1177826 RepID=A0ABP9EY29_9GAMM
MNHSMARFAVAMICGPLFGAGLVVSGMADPAKVLGFLDVSRMAQGTWDPSLMLVMMGALSVVVPGYMLGIKPRIDAQQAPLCEARYHVPATKALDRPLLLGSALFGLGWGLVGICPGPALASLASGSPAVLGFVLSMVAGTQVARLLNEARNTKMQGAPTVSEPS